VQVQIRDRRGDRFTATIDHRMVNQCQAQIGRG
jgi:hypothetical protein